ncbi:MAG: class I SAM-dependent methyltransferase [Candidatus Hodarchaeota archaeon]
MNPARSNEEPTFMNQLKKFAIKGLLGFQTILLYGMGQRLGIFNYLLEKATSISESDEISSINFTLDELSQNLGLDPIYLDGWVHMAIECGIFELDDSCNKCIRTAPFVYYLLVDRKNLFYMGDNLYGYYYMAPFQDVFISNFKTGEKLNPFILPEEIKEVTQRMSAGAGLLVEKVFTEQSERHKRILERGGSLLEVGCGFGYNLEIWARNYPVSNMVGLDIDCEAVKIANEVVSHNNWEDRIEIVCTEVGEYATAHKKKFDVIVLNHVLHEMDSQETYRQKVFQDLYSLLKDDGLLVVGEHMIPGIFSPNQGRYFEIMHKWFEVGIGAQFYDEDSFREFIESTPFKKADLLQEGRNYFWAIQK